MSLSPAEPEVRKPKPIPCACCGDAIHVDFLAQLWKEPLIGYVCDPCKYRCKIAKAWLTHCCGTKSCQEVNERF